MDQLMQEIQTAIWNHDSKKVKELVEKALADKVDIMQIVNDGLVEGMKQIGEKFKDGDVFVPEVLVSARAMMAGMAILKPLLFQAGIKEKGLLVIGSVKDDLHDIGKNIVSMMFEGAGYKVVDLGVDVPTDKFLKAIEEYNPNFIGLAALLTTTMVNMKETTKTIKIKYPNVKVIIGGAPINQRFANEIGADAYASDAAVAIDKANTFLTSSPR
jgi:5-methyltetrahydrofolate--homocysteine methyltransferase